MPGEKRSKLMKVTDGAAAPVALTCCEKHHTLLCVSPLRWAGGYLVIDGAARPVLRTCVNAAGSQHIT